MSGNKYKPLENASAVSSAIAGDAQFIIFGENHADAGSERSHFVSLIPKMRENNVSMIGLELPPSMNSLFKSLQDKIKTEKLSKQKIDQTLNSYLRKRGFEMPELGASRKLSDILQAATQNNITVVGIDPTWDNPKFVDKLIKNYNSDNASDLFDLDNVAALNAKSLLSSHGDPAKPNGRMAILYGLAHGKCAGTPGIDRPPILKESLSEFASTETVSLVPDTLPQGLTAKNYRLMVPEAPKAGAEPKWDVTDEEVARALPKSGLKEAERIWNRGVKNSKQGKQGLSQPLN